MITTIKCDSSRFPQRTPDLLEIYNAAREAHPLFKTVVEQAAARAQLKAAAQTAWRQMPCLCSEMPGSDAANAVKVAQAVALVQPINKKFEDSLAIDADVITWLEKA